VLVYELTREDIVLKLEAMVNSEGEGISGGDTARHGGSGSGKIQGSVELELENESIKAIKKAVIAERNDLGRL
jgi:hypothetical protein